MYVARIIKYLQRGCVQAAPSGDVSFIILDDNAFSRRAFLFFPLDASLDLAQTVECDACHHMMPDPHSNKLFVGLRLYQRC